MSLLDLLSLISTSGGGLKPNRSIRSGFFFEKKSELIGTCHSYLAELPKLLILAPSATLRSLVRSSRSLVSESDNLEVVLGGDRWSVGVRSRSISPSPRLCQVKATVSDFVFSGSCAKSKLCRKQLK